MSKVIKLKARYNAKISVIKCAHCEFFVEVLRNHSKYCSGRCKTQESRYRKEKGFTFLLFRGMEIELKEFYKKHHSLFLQNPLIKDFYEIERLKETYSMEKSFKYNFDDFILYYFSNRKSVSFEIYCNEEKYKKWKSFKAKWSLLFEKQVSRFTRVIEDEAMNEKI